MTLITFAIAYLLNWCLVYIIGHIFFYFANRTSEKTPISSTLFAGTVGLVTFLSVIWTSARTVHVIFIIALLFYVYWIWKNNLSKKNIATGSIFKTQVSVNDLYIFLAVSAGWFIAMFTWFHMKVYPESGLLSPVHSDINFYSRLSQTIKLTGGENTLGSLNLFYPEIVGNNPYHYFEYYLNQAYQLFFSNNTLETFVISAQAHVLSLLSLFSIQLVRKTCGMEWKILILAPVLFLLHGIELPIGLSEAGNYVLPLIGSGVTKYGITYLLFMISGYLIYSQKWYYAIPIIICPVISFSFLPAVAAGITLNSLYHLIFSQENEKLFTKNTEYFNMALLLLVIASIFSFYFLFSPETQFNSTTVQVSDVLNDVTNNIKLVFNITVGSHIFFWIDYVTIIAFLLTLFLLNKKNPIPLLLKVPKIFLFIFFGAALGWGLTSFIHEEAFQLFYMPVSLLGNLMLFYGTIFTYKSITRYKSVLIIGILTVISIQTFGQIKKSWMFDRHENNRKNIECLLSYKKFNSIRRIAFISNENTKPTVYPLGSWLYHLNDKISFIGISPEILSSKNQLTPFYHFSKSYPDLDILKLQKEFISKNNIDILLISHELVDSNRLKDKYSLVSACEEFNIYLTN